MVETISDIGEFGLIRRIRPLLAAEGIRPKRVVVGIGDDAASFLPRSGYELLVTCDSMVEGRHYPPGFIGGFDLGRRAMTSNISDIGAMGGMPLYALVSLGLRGDAPVSEVEDLYRGFLAELNPLRASVVGGNLTDSGDGMFIDITLIGEAPKGKVVRRNGARPGDVILVTGYPGRAAAGLQLLLSKPNDARLSDDPLVRAYAVPSHRALVGQAAARTGYVTAMIDTSDGLAGDLSHICEESGVGADLFKEMVPLDGALANAAALLGLDPYDLILGASDDYELIITCKEHHVPALQSIAGAQAVPLTEVGRITDGRGVSFVLPDGERRSLPCARWDHFRPASSKSSGSPSSPVSRP